MGTLLRLLSLRVSATLTAAAWRGRTRPANTPPPFRPQLLLLLFLAMAALIAMPPNLRADFVQLRQYDELEKMNGSGPITGYDRVEGTMLKYFWARGIGNTNEWHCWNLDTARYDTNNTPGPGSPIFDATWTTNITSYGWSGTGLAVGNSYSATRELHRAYDVVMGTNTWLDGYTSGPTNEVSIPGLSDDGPAWLGASYNYTDTNSIPTRTYSLSRVSQVDLITSTNSAWSGSALFKLTASLQDSYQNAITNGYTVAGETPDTNGVVFKVFTDGTTNPVSPAITATNTHTNYSFTVSQQRVQLTPIEWKSNSTNDTNWQSGVVYALKGTTVMFRVKANVDDVVWPSNLPAWSNGSNGVTQISITFDTISSDTNGQWVTVTAGNTVSNQVVVFDFEVKFKADGVGLFTGRAEYPTTFGVGEVVNFVAKFDPAGISQNIIGWSASGMSTGAPDGDRCGYNASDSTLQAGAFTETITVIGTIIEGPSFGKERTNQFTVIKPTNAILKDVLPFTATNGTFLFASTNVGHITNQWSCSKKASYFLLPQNVSFHGIQIGEGTGPYRYSGGFFNNTNYPQGMTGFTNNYTNVTSGVIFTFEYPVMADHAQAAKYSAQHFTNYPSLSFEPNYFVSDQFGGNYGPGAVDVPHTPFLLTTLTGTIQIEYTRATTNTYSVTNVISNKHFWSNGKLIIEKASSGPHSKEYTDPSSSD